jgi:hypothetical protein
MGDLLESIKSIPASHFEGDNASKAATHQILLNFHKMAIAHKEKIEKCPVMKEGQFIHFHFLFFLSIGPTVIVWSRFLFYSFVSKK